MTTTEARRQAWTRVKTLRMCATCIERCGFDRFAFDLGSTTIQALGSDIASAEQTETFRTRAREAIVRMLRALRLTLPAERTEDRALLARKEAEITGLRIFGKAS